MSLTIGDALNKIRILKSRLSRTSATTRESIIVFEDEAPEYNYTAENKRRIELIEELRDLKTKVQRTNAQTFVEHEGKKVSLTELILINADVRSELAFQQCLLEQKPHYGLRRTEEVKRRFAEGFHKDLVRNHIEDLENRKEKIESLINTTNAKTILVED